MQTETPSVLELLGKGVSLEELARLAAQQLIALAMEAKMSVSMKPYRQIKTADGKAAMVRNGGTSTRMKQIWLEEHRKWNSRPLHLARYCSLLIDTASISTLQLDEGRLRVLVVMGAVEDGKMSRVAVDGGYRESAECWLELLRDLKERGMLSPKRGIGDGALGLWKALDKKPKTVQSSTRSLIHDIYRAETKKDVQEACARIQERYQVKYPKAVKTLLKDDSIFLGTGNLNIR